MGRIQLKTAIPPYMLSYGNEKAAIEKERIPVRAHNESERRRLGKIETMKSPKACEERTRSILLRVIQSQEPCIGYPIQP